jgi:hypothetical protein
LLAHPVPPFPYGGILIVLALLEVTGRLEEAVFPFYIAAMQMEYNCCFSLKVKTL